MSQNWTDLGILAKGESKQDKKPYVSFNFNENIFVASEGAPVEKPEQAKSLKAFVSTDPFSVVEKRSISFGKDKPLFGILEITKDRDGNITKQMIRINENIELANGSEILEIGKYRNLVCNDPVEKVEMMIKNGAIKESDAERRRESAANSASWLLCHVTLPPPKKD